MPFSESLLQIYRHVELSVQIGQNISVLQPYHGHRKIESPAKQYMECKGIFELSLQVFLKVFFYPTNSDIFSRSLKKNLCFQVIKSLWPKSTNIQSNWSIVEIVQSDLNHKSNHTINEFFFYPAGKFFLQLPIGTLSTKTIPGCFTVLVHGF